MSNNRLDQSVRCSHSWLDQDEAACAQFEAAWREGLSPCIEDYLRLGSLGHDHSSSVNLLAELVMLDQEYRWRAACARSGKRAPLPAAVSVGDSDPPTWPARPLVEDYSRRLASIAALDPMLDDLISHEYEIRHRWGDCPEKEEYLARFGDRSTRLVSLLFDVDEELACETTKDASERTETLPRMLGRFELRELLGRGGMGTVYRAWHTRLQREVAVKMLRPELAEDHEALTRFKNEMRIAGHLNHPNVVRALDADEIDKTHVLVTECVEGCDLKSVIHRFGPLPVADACEVMRQAALGLQCIHESGLVHRDIKPSNLLLSRGGLVRIVDLGLARLLDSTKYADDVTAKGEFLGTPDFVAPEQINGSRAVDIRADIFSLGCTCYMLLTGHVPFAGTENATLLLKLHARTRGSITPIWHFRPDVPDTLVAILDRMLAKDPDERFSTPAQVACALEPLAADHNLLWFTERSQSFEAMVKAEAVARNAVQLARSQTNVTTDGRLGQVNGGRKRFRLVTLSVLLLGILTTGIVGSYWWRTTNGSLEVRRFDICHFAGEDEQLKGGVIGVDAWATRSDDYVDIRIELNQPSYCYLIAFNPDGNEQLCYPSDQSQPPSRQTAFRFPASQTSMFRLSDGVGQQVFALIASGEPLPPYQEWRKSVGTLPWKPSVAPGVWHYDGRELRCLPAQRAVEQLPGVTPLRMLCDALNERSRAELIELWAFPVLETVNRDRAVSD